MNALGTEDNKKIVRRFVEEFKNKANHNIVDELFTPDPAIHFPIPGLPPGRDALKQLGPLVVMAFPDVHVTVEDLIAEGDKVVERTAAGGTHKGEFYGIPATGKQITWTEIHIYRLKDGKITELWSQIDLLGLLTQLGAFPASK